MDTMNLVTTVNAAAGHVRGESSALVPSGTVVRLRARTHAGLLIDRTFAPDSAPWMHPVC
jgi:hypothetical protein